MKFLLNYLSKDTETIFVLESGRSHQLSLLYSLSHWSQLNTHFNPRDSFVLPIWATNFFHSVNHDIRFFNSKHQFHHQSQSQYPCHRHFHSENSLFQKLGCRFLPIPSIVVTCFDHIVIFLNLEMVEKFLAHFYSHKGYVVVLYAFVDEYWWIRFFLRNHTPGSNLRSEILQPHSTSCLSTR